MDLQSCKDKLFVYLRYLTNASRLFMHGGFTNRICDFDWNKNDPWVMMGAAEDNQLQIFRAARKLVEPLPKTVNHGEVSD
jgi:histone-binding protein RBBP4